MAAGSVSLPVAGSPQVSQELAQIQQGLAQVSQELAALQTTGGGGTTYDPTPVTSGCGCCDKSYVTPVQAPRAPTQQQTADPGTAQVAPTTDQGTAPVDQAAGKTAAPTGGSDLPPEPMPIQQSAAPQQVVPSGQPAPTQQVDPTKQVVPSGQPAPTQQVDPTTGQPIPTQQVDPTTGQPKTAVAQAATTPANQLADWSGWTAKFVALGVDQANIDRIGKENLTDTQLEVVYATIGNEMQKAGISPSGTGTPDATGKTDASGKTGGATPPGTGTGGWSAEWRQKFAALGLKPEEMTALETKATQPGVDDAALQALYDKLKADAATKGGSTTADPSASGWSDAWSKKFHDLGMPDSIVSAYQQSGAPESGLQTAYNFAKKRSDDVKKTGLYDKLLAEKMPADELWSKILADKPVDEATLRSDYDALHASHMSGSSKKLQLGISLFPGGELAQFALGHKFVSGKDIDQTSPMNIGLAALSGLALFAGVRGVMQLSRGWKAESGLLAGTAELLKTPLTMDKIGLHGQAASLSQAAEGALQTMGTHSRLASLIPFTAAHKATVGLGVMEAGAKALNNGGAEALMAAGPAGALQVSTAARTIEDFMRGTFKVQGGGNAYLGNLTLPFKQIKTAPMAWDEAKQTMTINKALSSARGDQALTAIIEAGGTRISQNPEIMSHVGQDQLKTIGHLMAGDAAKTLGATRSTGAGQVLGKLKPGVGEYFTRLNKSVARLEGDSTRQVASGAVDPLGWYHDLIGGASTELSVPGEAAAAQTAASAVLNGAGSVTHAAPASTAVADATHAADLVKPSRLNISLSHPVDSTVKQTLFVGGGKQEVNGAHQVIADAIAARTTAGEATDASVRLLKSKGGRVTLKVTGSQDIIQRLRIAVQDARDTALSAGSVPTAV